MKATNYFQMTGGCLALVSFLALAQVSRCQTVPFYVSFWYPTNGQSFAAPADVGVHALVTDSNIVRSVQYYSGASLIGTATNTGGGLLTNTTEANPFFLNWSDVPAGSYQLTAVAVDTMGNTATSAPVNITVTNPIIRPSVAIFSPANGTRYSTVPATVNIYARAVETNGTVASVQFLANSMSLGTEPNTNGAQSVFVFTWLNAPSGVYSLTAIATDTSGNTTTSAVVSITIAGKTPPPPPPPTPFAVTLNYPTNGESFGVPANVYMHAGVADSNVVQLVQYYSGGTLIGSVTNSSALLLTNVMEVNPLYLTWSNVPAGSYPLTAVAIDTTGNTATSAPVNISVTNVPPPTIPYTVSFGYPTNGQTFIAPASIGLHARVTDSNLVESVQYFANGTSIGTVSSPVLLTNSAQVNPFFLDWSNVPAGDYGLTAVALDNTGNTATSGPVVIHVVTNEPTVTIWAPDPVAVKGTNYMIWFRPASVATNYTSGTNTATFLVRRDSMTNTSVHHNALG